MLVLPVHGNRLGQNIVQMQSCSTVHYKSSLGQNILIHLMKHIPELGHSNPVNIENQGIKEPRKFPGPLSPVIRNRRHNGKIRVRQLLQLFQIVRNDIPLCFTVPLDLQSNPIERTTLTRERNSDSIRLFILIMPFPLKRPLREDLTVKLKRRNLF